MIDVAQLDLPPHDLLLVGDGSGTTHDKACGWCVYSFETLGRQQRHFGGANTGTNNYAELFPYVHALWHYQATGGTGRRVVIVSDSQITVRCGNQEYARRANAPLWAAIEWFESQGYVFFWRHVNRSQLLLNSLSDKVAGQLRLLFAEAKNDG